MLAGLSTGHQQIGVGEAAMLAYFAEHEVEQEELLALLHPDAAPLSLTLPMAGVGSWLLLSDVDWWDSLFDEL